MSHSKKLIQDTMLYTVAQFGSRILLFLMLPFYTHYFSPDEFGIWDLTVTTIAFLTPFISMEIIAAVYRWLLDTENEGKRKTIISTGIYFLIKNMLIFTSIAIVILLWIPVPYGVLALLVILTDVLYSFMQQITRGLGKNRLFASLGIFHAIIFISVILFLIFTLNLRIEAFFYATIVANFSLTIFALFRGNIYPYISYAYREATLIKPLLAYALPIIPGALSWWVISLADRYFITWYLGVHENGIFAIAAKIPAAFMLLNNVFALAWKDSAIRTFHDEEKNTYYSNVFSVLFKGLSSAVICILLISKPLIHGFIGIAYADAWKYGNILLIGALFHACALFWAAGFHGAKETKPIFTSAILGAIISILGNILLIPLFGLYAVAGTSAISFLAVWVVRVKQASPTFHIHIHRKVVVIAILGVSIAWGLPYVFGNVLLLLSTVGAFLLFAILWREDVWAVLGQLKKD